MKITVAEAAEIIGCDPSTVRRLIRRRYMSGSWFKYPRPYYLTTRAEAIRVRDNPPVRGRKRARE